MCLGKYVSCECSRRRWTCDKYTLPLSLLFTFMKERTWQVRWSNLTLSLTLHFLQPQTKSIFQKSPSFVLYASVLVLGLEITPKNCETLQLQNRWSMISPPGHKRNKGESIIFRKNKYLPLGKDLCKSQIWNHWSWVSIVVWIEFKVLPVYNLNFLCHLCPPPQMAAATVIVYFYYLLEYRSTL